MSRKRSPDEVSVGALLYRRYPEHAEEIRIYENLLPEDRKTAIRYGLRLMALLRRDPQRAATILSEIFTAPLPLAVASPSTATPETGTDSSGPKFDLFCSEVL